MTDPRVEAVELYLTDRVRQAAERRLARRQEER